ncbi:divisome protein SepX/GlpR [Dactylosporangium sp. CA-139066]|uniref:divisome protein SepX/GlpR n=1 Tax=Dactylosporangium sp. CA-139066 TaxID=3239930 RepID=UPI003D89C120
MRVPTSVLLAVLAAAGLLALAPALVRRYDATERLVAERALSTARVLTRVDRRRRTVPGRRPINPPRLLVPRVSSASGPLPPPRRALTPVSPTARRRVHRAPRAMYRRRRVLLALVLLNLVEVCGITLVSPGFWVGFAVTGVLLVAYLAHLRTRALRDRRRRREEARYAAWIARRQALVRREQLRRAAARREALAHQLAERDRARREAARLNSLRGRPYDTRASGQ